jgi:NAD(P)-dependent dehydrogenase (short-subunit alcohol dehydrogenase family)
MAGSFDGKVALVTGASSGIGRATAIAFSRQGAKVVAADVVTEGGEETVRIIQDSGGDAIFVKTDVSQSDQVESLIKTAVGSYGRVDCAHNNAGIEGAVAQTHEYLEDAWDSVMSINLKGVWLCMKYEIPQMLSQGNGAIVNTASAAGLVGIPGQLAYVASKHGVTGLTKVAALENAARGIRVNSVCPGVVRTSMIDRFISLGPAYDEERIISMEPVGRMGTPEEIAEAVVWLCSDSASFVTGHNMSVDGGLVAQ